MAFESTYVSKGNLANFTVALKKKLDVTYAKIDHKHDLTGLTVDATDKLVLKEELFYAASSDPVNAPKFAGQLYMNNNTNQLFIGKDIGGSSSFIEIPNMANLNKLLEGKADIKHYHEISDLTNRGGNVIPPNFLPEASLSTKGIIAIGTGALEAAPGNHGHSMASDITDGFMSKEDYTKLKGLSAYSHPTGDGNEHVPATGRTNEGRVLMAGSLPGEFGWRDLPLASDTQKGIISASFFDLLTKHTLSTETTRHKTADDNTKLASIGDATQLTTTKKVIVPAMNEMNANITQNIKDIKTLSEKVAGTAGTHTALDKVEFEAMDPAKLMAGTICYVINTTSLTVNGKTYDGSPTSFIIVDPDGTGGSDPYWVELSAMTPTMEAGSIKFTNVDFGTDIDNVEKALNKLHTDKLDRTGLVANKVVIVGPDASASKPLLSSNVDARQLEYLADLTGAEKLGALLDKKSDKTHTHTVSDLTDLTPMTNTDIEDAITAAFAAVGGIGV